MGCIAFESDLSKGRIMMTVFRGSLVLSAVMVLAGSGWSEARADATCVLKSKANFLACARQCKQDFVDARLLCHNISPACGDACLAGRQVCLDTATTILQTGQLPGGGTLANCSGGTDQCKATFEAAKQACHAPCQPADTQCTECVDNAQVVAFECRDTCRDSWRTNPTVIAMLQSCQSSFKACIQKCAPPANATTTTTPTTSTTTTTL
jgi:hypothetical protein